MKKKGIFILVILVLVAIVVGIIATRNTFTEEKNNVITSTTKEKKLIKVNEVTRSVFYAPQYVAINNGYFEENGIEIDLTTGQGADAI